MKKNFLFVVIIFIFSLFQSAETGADNQGDRAVVPLSKPGQPATIGVSVLNGSITVSGYDGKEVIVEARQRGETISGEEKSSSRYPGMKRLNAVTGTGLEVSEENNKIEVLIESWKATIDITLKVPFNSSLELHSTNSGDIVVENISGEIEANNTNGGIRLTGISGSAVASTTNGDVKVTFVKINPQKPMSFASFNGDVDVTFPADLKADVQMKTDQGEVYSEFEIATKAGQRKVEEREKEGKRFVIRFDKMIYGTINGGGQQFQFSTFNGDILLRRGK